MLQIMLKNTQEVKYTETVLFYPLMRVLMILLSSVKRISMCVFWIY